MKRVLLTSAAIALAMAIALPPARAQAPELFSVEVGTRYWYSSGKFQKTLYDNSGSLQISKLTYSGQTGHAGEGYYHIVDPTKVFLKGYFGVGGLTGGNLRDEDFPPVIAPYSSTDSDFDKSILGYVSVDLGYYLIATPTVKLGGFVGYHYDREKMNAYGCTQTATHPGICVPAISNSVKVITQDNQWHSLRIGAAGEVMLTPNLRLSGDAAYLPYVKLWGADTHWLRLGVDFNGPTPETGHGTGMQFEGVLSYIHSSNLTLGVGARYWRMQIPRGWAHFDTSVIGGALPQVEKFYTDRYGVFVQLGYKY